MQPQTDSAASPGDAFCHGLHFERWGGFGPCEFSMRSTPSPGRWQNRAAWRKDRLHPENQVFHDKNDVDHDLINAGDFADA
ncbi:MAG: hypothetical protein WBI05_00240 [Rhodoferax sp.]|jgi:hypothetical protein|uniref:hypothetical protein n=1 Tax=Rhodoferax sp. TaxID=50421 RepID=UPI003BB5C410